MTCNIHSASARPPKISRVGQGRIVLHFPDAGTEDGGHFHVSSHTRPAPVLNITEYAGHERVVHHFSDAGMGRTINVLLPKIRMSAPPLSNALASDNMITTPGMPAQRTGDRPYNGTQKGSVSRPKSSNRPGHLKPVIQQCGARATAERGHSWADIHLLNAPFRSLNRGGHIASDTQPRCATTSHTGRGHSGLDTHLWTAPAGVAKAYRGHHGDDTLAPAAPAQRGGPTS